MSLCVISAGLSCVADEICKITCMPLDKIRYRLSMRHLISMFHRMFSGSDEISSHIFYVTDDGRTKPRPQDGQSPEPSEHKCIIRVALGNKKLATVVSV